MLEVLGNADPTTTVDVSSLDDVSLHALIIDTQQQIDRLNAVNAKAIAAWDSRHIWADDGSRNAASRLARETGIAPREARRLVHRANKLSTMPATLDAFSAGALSSDRVDLLVQANQSELAEVFQRDEAVLVSSTRRLRFADAVKTVRYWQQMANEVGAEERSQRLLDQRTATLSTTFQGTCDVRALFDPIGGAIFANELDRLEGQLFDADWAEAREQFGDGATAHQLARTPTQRRCDALVRMAERSAAKPVGAQEPRPLLSIVLNREGLERVCELANGTVLTPGQVVPLLSRAQIERIVFDGPSRVIDYGRKRLFTGALRRVLEIRDQYCQHSSGCDVVASKCEGDHLNPFMSGGETSQSNGQLLCAFHNRAKGSDPPMTLTG